MSKKFELCFYIIISHFGDVRNVFTLNERLISKCYSFKATLLDVIKKCTNEKPMS